METTIKKVPKTKEQWGSFLNHFKQNKWLYILTIPGIIYFAVFRYAPMYGLIIAFKDYVPFLGIADSPWVGTQNFMDFFNNPDFFRILWNMLIIKTILNYTTTMRR